MVFGLWSVVYGLICMNNNILNIKNLSTYFFTDDGVVKAVNDISFSLKKAETLAIVGESGCGKSVTSLSIMRLINYPGKIINGEMFFNNQDLLKLSDEQIRQIRGNKISLIFQDPFTSLNPVFTIGDQLTEAVRFHKKISADEAKELAFTALKKVRINSPEQRMKSYPHELSGGQRQRVMIAMSIICGPEILIADEPTTALDVTIQAQILDLMADLKKQMTTSVILITHNLGIVANFCERVIVMYAGNMVEEASTYDIFTEPKHPYTKALLECLPKLTDKEKQKLVSIKGQMPNLTNLPCGCAFAPRCGRAMDICGKSKPEMTELPGRKVRCFLYAKLA